MGVLMRCRERLYLSSFLRTELMVIRASPPKNQHFFRAVSYWGVCDFLKELSGILLPVFSNGRKADPELLAGNSVCDLLSCIRYPVFF